MSETQCGRQTRSSLRIFSLDLNGLILQNDSTELGNEFKHKLFNLSWSLVLSWCESQLKLIDDEHCSLMCTKQVVYVVWLVMWKPWLVT